MKISKSIIIAVIALVMLNNVEHLAWVHYSLAVKLLPELAGDWLNIAHSVLVVIIFEVVVITFAMLGKKGYSLFFVACIWVLSQIYYDVPALISSGQWQQVVAATVYSTIFTISIYMFSELLADHMKDESLIEIYKRKVAEQKEKLTHLAVAEQEVQRLSALLQDKQQEITQLKQNIAEYQLQEQQRKEELLCPHCREYQAETESELRSHKGRCAKKIINHESQD